MDFHLSERSALELGPLTLTAQLECDCFLPDSEGLCQCGAQKGIFI